MRIYLEYSDGKSNKFWEGVVDGSTLTTRWGRVGATGQTKSAELDDEAAAEAALDKKAKAKIKKGYAEVASTVSNAADDTAAHKKIVAKALEPVELSGEIIRLSDYPKVFAFNEDGTRLAGVGISSVHLVDVSAREWSKTAKSREAGALCWVGDKLVIGTKSITVADGETAKKKLALKGHKATANAMVSDGARLYTGGGSYIYTNDRFVRAFDLDSGDLVWKAKPGKGAGAVSLALAGERVCVAAEDGCVRIFAADDGAVLGELALGPAEQYSSIFGGVVACGPEAIAAAAVVDFECTVSWIELEPAPRVVASTEIPLAKVDRSEGCFAGAPLALPGRVLVPIYYCVEGYSRTVIAELDVGDRSLVALHRPAGLQDARGCALSVDGVFAWAVAEGVALAPIVAGKASKTKKKTTKKKTAKKKTPTEPTPLGEPLGVTAGGPDRRACFEGKLTKEPKVVWARAEYYASAGEFGGSVCVAEGAALGCYGEEIAALSTEAKGETSWSTRCAKPRTYPTSGIAIAEGTVFMATNQGLHAFSRETGEALWKAKLRGAEGAPLVFEGLCIIGANGGLHARSLAKKGRKLWTFEVKDRVVGAPAYADGLLYFYADTALMALDAATRELRWSVPAQAPQRTPPVVNDELVIYMPTYGAFAALDRASGTERWRVENTEARGGSPFALAEDRLLFRGGEGKLHAHRLSDGAHLWTSTGGRDTPYGIGGAGPIVVGTTVVCVTVDENSMDRCLTGLDLGTGEVRWDLDNAKPSRAMKAEQKRTGSSFSGQWSWYCTPTFADGVLYAQTDAGIVALK